MAKERNKTPLRSVIRDLSEGESIDFPIDRLQSVKTTCTDLGLIYERKFKTKTNRVKKTISVTRIKYHKL